MQPPSLIVLGMSLGILLNWNVETRADTQSRSATHAAVVRIAGELGSELAAGPAKGESSPLSAAQTRELAELTRQLREVSPHDDVSLWIAVQNLEACLQRIPVSAVVMTSSKSAAPAPIKSATWQVTIGRGHIRSSTASLAQVVSSNGSRGSQVDRLLLSLRRAVATLTNELQQKLLPRVGSVTLSPASEGG